MESENLESSLIDDSKNGNPPEISLCFDKLVRKRTELDQMKVDLEIESSKISKKPEFNRNNTHSQHLDTSKTQKQEKSVRKQQRFKQSRMAALISNLGKLVIFVRGVKKSIDYRDMRSLTPKQFQLIDDFAYPKNCFEEKRRKKILFEKSKMTRFKLINIIVQLIIFLEDIVWKKFISKVFLPFRKIPVFLPTNRFILIWKLVICFIVLFELFIIPIKIFFKQNTGNIWPQWLESFSKVILWMDFVIDMNTAVYKRGELILDRKIILKKYLRSQITSNMITTISLHLEWGSASGAEPLIIYSSLNLIKMIFFLRMRQVSHIFSQVEELMHNDEFYEGLLSLLRLLLQIFFITHIFCCIWNFVAYRARKSGTKSWQDAVFYSDDDSAEEVSLERAYLYSFYWSLTTVITVGYGDISPKNDSEVIVSSLAMLFGSGFFAYGINKIGVIFEKFEEKRTKFKNEFRIIDNLMQRKRIEYSLQVKVFKYLEHMFEKSKSLSIEAESLIFSKLSQDLRKDLLVQANGSLISKYPTFSKTLSKETLDRLSQQVRTINYAPEELIYNESQIDNHNLYFLVTGEVETFVKRHSKNEGPVRVLRTIKEGECFGEEGFFTKQPRKSAARSKTFSSVITISEEEFLSVLRDSRQDWEKFYMLRDKILLYREFSILSVNCDSCGNSNHLFDKCPFLQYIPNRDLILRKHIYSENQERGKLRRKKKKKSKNALFNNFVPLFKNKTTTLSDTESDGELGENKDKGEEEDEENENNLPRRRSSKKKLFIMNKQSSTSLKNEQTEDEDDESESNSQKHGHLKRERYISSKTSTLTQNKNSQYTGSELPLIFGGLNTEKMQVFEHYFPYNNCEEVLKFFENLNKKEVIQKKVQSKFKRITDAGIQGKPHHKSGKLASSGLIQFRNMQNFFLKRKITTAKSHK